MKNLFVLPTDKPSKLIHNVLGYGRVTNEFTKSDLELIQAEFQNIYITSDEEIKEGDWFYEPINKSILKYDSKSNKLIKAVFSGFCKKIILTTDKDLIKYGVQAIDDEFLEWFVKNPSCQKILIGIEIWNDGGFSYRIIIPKEEPKGFIPDGNWNHEEEVQVSDYNKQETIHGVAHRLFSTMPSEISTSTAKSKALELAKWQQEQEKNKYSEEEMLKMLHKFGFDYTYNYKGEKTIYEWIPEWFEEYKRLNN